MFMPHVIELSKRLINNFIKGVIYEIPLRI